MRAGRRAAPARSGASGPASASRNASQLACSSSASSAITGYGPGGSRRCRGRQRGGEAAGVGGRAQPGRERVAIAVVGGAGDAARDDAAERARNERCRPWPPSSSAERAPPAAGAALARRSASSSRQQIGQLVVRRLWRQNSDTGSNRCSGSGKTVPPRAGVSVTAPRRMRSPCPPAGASANRATTARSTSFISSVANAAPAQRRTPPPKGIQVPCSGAGAPRKRSGRKASGSGPGLRPAVHEVEARRDMDARGQLVPGDRERRRERRREDEDGPDAQHLLDHGVQVGLVAVAQPRLDRGMVGEPLERPAQRAAVVSWPAASTVTSWSRSSLAAGCMRLESVADQRVGARRPPLDRAGERASTAATSRRKAPTRRPRWSDIASSRGSDAFMSSARRIAAAQLAVARRDRARAQDQSQRQRLHARQRPQGRRRPASPPPRRAAARRSSPATARAPRRGTRAAAPGGGAGARPRR